MSKTIRSRKSARSTSKAHGRGAGLSATRRALSKSGAVTVGVKVTTLRLAPEFEAGLCLLKRFLHMPVNKMVNEAVGEYIQKRAADVETDLTGVLEQVKAYRRADPQFKQALAQFVTAEARYGGDDPVEGVVVDVEPPTRVQKSKAQKSKAGPAQTMVRELLKR
jgi:hypothetical protein